MITYAKIKDGAVEIYPYGLGKLREENPNVSFPNGSFTREDIRSVYGVVEVAHVEKPYTAGWHSNQVGPVESNGSWSQKWEQVPKTAEELSPQDITNPETPRGDVLQDEHGVESKFAVDNGPIWKDDHWEIDWIFEELPYRIKRLNAYGASDIQLEYITENGLEAWQSRVAEIKAQYPKS